MMDLDSAQTINLELDWHTRAQILGTHGVFFFFPILTLIYVLNRSYIILYILPVSRTF